MRPMNFVNTPALRVGYEDHNPRASRTAILVHGWPDSTRTWAGVVPELARAGWRVLVPALRGFAPTTFRDPAAPRVGQLAALGRDLLEFAAALGIDEPALVGHDWGARAAAIACGLRPGVASHLAMISVGYGTNDPNQALSLHQARNYWYHWYMATPRGERTVRENGRAFAQIMWDTWSPPGWYAREEFEATARAFHNPDWADVTLHSYRHRWGHAPGAPEYDGDEAALVPAPVLEVPTLLVHGTADGANHPDSSAGRERFFRGRYERVLLEGVGHFPQREAPRRVAEELLRFLGE
ncbi:MAG TPA: alpha/beta hydrolase [Burkholderiaceae bacterium]